MKKLLILLYIGAAQASPMYSVVDRNSGKYLEGSNVYEHHSIASLTKLMSAYVFLTNHPDVNHCSSQITQDDRDDLKGTKTKLVQNRFMTCAQILQVMLIASDNWAASALSKTIPGISSQSFVDLMNQQARSWGMKSTKFTDSSGLSPSNISNIIDLNILVSRVARDPVISYVTGQRSLTVGQKGSVVEFKNTNKLIRELNWGSVLSKTGYIKESGYNLAFIPKKCQNLSLVILGADSSQSRASFAQKILGKYKCA